MIIISLLPIVWPDTDNLSLSVQGDVISVVDEALDMSGIPRGATLPDARQATGCKYFSGDIERDDDGVLYITLLLPHGDNALEEARFPSPIIVTEDGPVKLPNVDDIEDEY